MTLPDEAREVLGFWFDELKPEQWFRPSEGLDEAIADRFGGLHRRLAESGVPDAWLADARGRLAAVIVLDQFPRNIHRGEPGAFATDAMALALAQGTIRAGLDGELGEAERMFLYMPFQHAEDRSVQERSVKLFESLARSEAAKSARDHRDVIDRFGRFPHRNSILGRTSTPDEDIYLARPGAGFGWTGKDGKDDRKG